MHIRRASISNRVDDHRPSGSRSSQVAVIVTLPALSHCGGYGAGVKISGVERQGFAKKDPTDLKLSLTVYDCARVKRLVHPNVRFPVPK
jgi:hypothetical protein